MGSLDRERALTGSEPIELFWFAVGANNYYYTNNVDDVTFQNTLFKAVPIKRSNLVRTSAVGEDRQQFELSEDLEVARLFIAFPPALPVWVTIYRLHEGENDFFYFWRGRVSSAERRDYVCIIDCEPVLSSARKRGLRRRFGSQCNHMLYDARCGVSESAYRFDTTIQAINGRTLTVASVNGNADGYYAGGRVRLVRSGDLRFIVKHTGNALRLSAPFADAQVGDIVQLYAGCDHRFSTCKNKFNNALNFGGFPFIPTQNPFERI